MGKLSPASRFLPCLGTRLALWGLGAGWLCSALLPSISRADFQLQDWKLHRAEKGEWNLVGSLSAFQTSTNRDGTGKLVDINGLDQYRRTATNLALEWGAHSRLTLYFRGTWLWNDIRGTSYSANRFGLSDQSLGLSLRLIDKSLIVDLQIQADLPAYSNVRDAGAGLPFLGDSSTDFTVGGFATLPLVTGERQWTLRGGAGYTVRSAQFSAAVPWSLEILTRPEARGLTFAAGASGFQSLKTDPRGNVPISASQFSPSNGGSFLVNAVNPSLAAASVSVGYRTTESTAFHAAYRRTIWGQAIADGGMVEAGFRWNISSQKPAARKALGVKRVEKAGLTRYAGDGKVTAVVNTRTLMVNLGSDAGLAMGDLVDIFSVLPDGSIGEPVARGQVVHLDIEQSQISILEIYQETAIKEGFVARKPIAL
jgi:hypothetical protein